MHWWILLLPLVACSPAQREWRSAKHAGTAEALRPIANNLSHKKRAKAYKRVEAMDWKEAEAKDTSRLWKGYISHYPSSPRVDEARRRRGEARWNEVLRADSRSTYERFLSLNGASPHAAEAREKIEELAWREATAGGTEEDYARYLIRNPQGSYAQQARERREEIFWARAVRSDRAASYRGFLERFPHSTHAAEVADLLDSFRFSGVVVRVVSREQVRADSLSTYTEQLKSSLGEGLEAKGFEVHWVQGLDARPSSAINPLAELNRFGKKDCASLVIEVRERRGGAFDPDGFATDITAMVYLVPPGKTEAMEVREVTATTSDDVIAESAADLHRDAQHELGYAILDAGFGFSEWHR